MKNISVKIAWSLFLLFAIFQSFSCKDNGWTKGETKMHENITIYSASLSGLVPEMYPLREEVYSIFAVPENNCIGTNDIDNAISLIRFTDNGLEYKIVRKDFLRFVGSGDFLFLPALSGELIGYVQTRGFLLFNIKTKEFTDYLICSLFEEQIGKAVVVDIKKKLFLFEIDNNSERSGEQRTLQLMDLNTEPAKIIHKMNICPKRISYTPPWVYQKGIMFIYDESSSLLKAFNLKFESVSHPLVDLFNNNRKTFRRLDQMYIHEGLPFALFVEIDDDRDNYLVWLAYWRKDEQKMFPIYGLDKEIICEDFTFSPEGDLLIYQDEANITSNDDRSEFIAVPIDKKNPIYLGKPLNLGKLPVEGADAFTTAWISSPLSFVVTDSEILYRWNFEKIKF